MNCKHLRRFTKSLSLVCVLLAISSGYRTLAQDKLPEKITEKSTYKSSADDSLLIDRVSVLPFTDNLQGIYARPLEAHMISLVDKMHRWNYVAANTSGPLLTPEELESSPDQAIKVSQNLDADAFFAVRVTKGPKGISIHMSLFLTKDGKLFAQAVLKDYNQYDIAELKEQIQNLLRQLVTKIPYSGRIMSREGQRITLNLGSRDGIKPNQVLSVIQFISVNRHPKFNFIISTEKEIIGKIKVLKVDETLSFGTVLTERERGAVQKNAKVTGIDFVSYAGGDLSLTPLPEEALEQRQDSAIAFGKDARAWKPVDPASIGQVGARIGFSRFNGKSNLTGVSPLDFSNNWAPMVHLDGELWITPEWTAHARIRQGIISVDNPRGGSSPSELNLQYSYYEALGGYAIRFGAAASSAFVEPFFGFMTYKLFADTSTPDALTTMNYSGFKWGVRGASPVTADGIWGAGGEFGMVWKPGLSESPNTSGDSSENSIVQFSIFGYKRMSERLKAQVNLDFEMYSSTFSGAGSRATPASSTSHRYTTLTGGIYYMF